MEGGATKDVPQNLGPGNQTGQETSSSNQYSSCSASKTPTTVDEIEGYF